MKHLKNPFTDGNMADAKAIEMRANPQHHKDKDSNMTEANNKTYNTKEGKTRVCHECGKLILLTFSDYKNTWNLVDLGHQAMHDLEETKTEKTTELADNLRDRLDNIETDKVDAGNLTDKDKYLK